MDTGRTNYRRTPQDSTGHHRTTQDTAGQHRTPQDNRRTAQDGSMEIQSLGGIRPPEGGGLAYPCRVPIYMWLYMVWLCRHHDPFAASTLYLHKLIAWGQIVAESKFPPFVGWCRFPVLQIRVVSSPCSPLSMQLEPVTHVLVFDVVNTTTIQGLGIRPTYSFASLL